MKRQRKFPAAYPKPIIHSLSETHMHRHFPLSIPLLAVLFLYAAPVAFAADISFPGAPLATDPFNVNNSLFPGGSLSGNTVTITGGNIPGDVYGGVVNGPADVSGNTVTVSGASTMNTLYGGRSAGGLVSGNSIIFNNGSVTNAVIGGRSGTGAALGNSVTIYDGNIASSVRGGQSDGGEASSNFVQVFGGNFGLDIEGGRSGLAGPALNNVVRIYNLTISREIVGGAATGSGDARGNELEIFNGATRGNIFAGRASMGNTADNRLILHGGDINLSAHGGHSESGSSTGNAVIMLGGTVHGNAYGGRIENGGGNAEGNTAVVFGGSVAGSVYGARHRGSGPAVGNLAQLFNGSVGADFYGGYSASGPATDNVAEIAGGSVAGGVYGGFNNNAAGAAGNRVTIAGGRFGNDIHGGFSAAGPATGNTVNLAGMPDISAATLYGGLSPGGGDAFSGNTFNVNGFRGSAKGILNFENYNFFTPALGNRDTQISITGGVPTNMAGTTVKLWGMEGGPPYLRPGDSIVLIDKVTGTPASADGGQVPKGALLIYDFDISTSDGTLRASLRDRRANPDAGILPAGQTAALAFLHNYTDLITGLAADKLLEPEERRAGPTVYAVGAGGVQHYVSDSSVSLRGASLLTGIDWRPPLRDLNLTVGAFFETGHGVYNAGWERGRFGAIEGEGAMRYYGGGVLAVAGLPFGFYAEASLRAGSVQSDFSSRYTVAHLGRSAEYELSQAYYGAHAGLGRLWRINEHARLDVYGKFLWLRQGGGETDMLRETVSFKPADSQRWRGGARLSYDLPGGFTPYIGAAYDYEADGEVRAEAGGVSFSSSPLRGGSVIGELGCAYKGSGGLIFDLTAKAFGGIRSGVAGRLLVGFEF